ncbi:hypothetical protein A9R05_41835 (plasmid) [Burkholderia sp. KK1]|uniref:hypothetical protein n=1 Tax=Burkholderia sp. M701 TaxID=326454 RepID=UPI000979ACAA|nr:hypothetical protein [Burkholderia sp. M701]AQH05567.1 hypothetical protein A9R05_41835 [Burkholderia sp. KK1]
MIEAITIPFFRPDDDKPDTQFANAVRAMNEHVDQHALEVVSIETIAVPRFLWLGQRPVALRVWVKKA